MRICKWCSGWLTVVGFTKRGSAQYQCVACGRKQ